MSIDHTICKEPKVEVINLIEIKFSLYSSMGSNENNRIKAVVLGFNWVGKTTLLIRYKRKQLPESYTPTVVDTDPPEEIVINNKLWSMSVWDTFGSEEHIRLRPLFFPESSVFLICFDVSSRERFEYAESQFVTEVKHHSPRVPIVLLGTKIDLRYDEIVQQQLRDKNKSMVSEAEGHALAKKIGAVKYVECSAVSGQNVDEVFRIVADAGAAYEMSKCHKKPVVKHATARKASGCQIL